ncbi:MAG: sulfotransferase, partial [Oscillatoriales cyanobacterium]
SPELSALTSGFYAQHLRRWFQHVDHDRLLILQAETFFAQPDSIMAEVHQFLGLPHIALETYRPYNAGSYAAAEAHVRAKLAEFFAPYNQDLETLLDRQFNW